MKCVAGIAVDCRKRPDDRSSRRLLLNEIAAQPSVGRSMRVGGQKRCEVEGSVGEAEMLDAYERVRAIASGPFVGDGDAAILILRHDVVAARAEIGGHVVAVPAIQGVIALASDENVGTAIAGQSIVAFQTPFLVVSGVARNQVGGDAP